MIEIDKDHSCIEFYNTQGIEGLTNKLIKLNKEFLSPIKIKGSGKKLEINGYVRDTPFTITYRPKVNSSIEKYDFIDAIKYEEDVGVDLKEGDLNRYELIDIKNLTKFDQTIIGGVKAEDEKCVKSLMTHSYAIKLAEIMEHQKFLVNLPKALEFSLT